ncbi:MAG: hypothetical protein P8R42_05195 [Candidatus Binatia bacterium]|nr:hypothetical protein [Candidatus Binatia bacterium]
MSGNVFYTDGRPPIVLSCDRIVLVSDEATYRGFDAPDCRLDDGVACRCLLVGEVVLPTSFLVPTADRGLLRATRIGSVDHVELDSAHAEPPASAHKDNPLRW